MIGQSVGPDASRLSCFLFRPRKRLEKRRKRSHINASNASVTRTSRVSQTPLQTPIPYFPSMGTTRQKSSCRNRLQNGPHSLLRMKVGHTRLRQQDRTQRLTHRNTGRFSWGCYHYPRSVPHVHEHPRVGYQNGKLCRFWVLAGGAPEDRRKPAGQRCAYARRCSEASRPRWAA